MAKNPTPTPTPTPTPKANRALDLPALNPETTPIPGGGSWRWTDAGWVSNDLPADLPEPEPEPTPATAIPTTQPE